MSTPSFNLTQEQIETLEECKKYRYDSEVQKWRQEELDAVKNFNDILQETNFQENDLSGTQLDQLFKEMRKIVNNRALARNLYETNGLETFNKALRELLYGESALAERVDQFLDLQGVGKTTVSQFLCIHEPMEYPIVTEQTLSILDISSSQHDQAQKVAILNHNIPDPSRYHNRTIEYLRDMLIYSKIKETLEVNDYLMVNAMLWKEYIRRTEGIEPTIPLASVSIEADLRSYLAKNPHLLGRGLSVIGEEYNTKEIGRIDLLLKDEKGEYVIVETKKGRSSDKVIGQILRYMGWVQKNLGGPVKGIVIVAEPDSRLEYSLIPIQNVKIKYYRVKFELSDSPN